MITRRLIVALVATIGVVAPATTGFGWNEPDGFRGLKWGASQQELQRQMPKARCYGPICNNPLELTQVGPVHVVPTFYFSDGGLARVILEFSPSAYDALRSIFVERYGAPTSEQREPVKTGAGAEFVNEIAIWDGGIAAVRLEKYSGKITDGRATIRTAKDRDEEVAKFREQMRKGKDDL